MGYFPMCMDLAGKPVLLIGKGKEIDYKVEKLLPFGPEMICRERFDEKDLEMAPLLVVVGDTEEKEAERIAAICREHRIPINVVDVPRLCTFIFPALITAGDLTISVSTAGKSPAAAVYLRKQISAQLPDRTEEILDWLAEVRMELRRHYEMNQYKGVLSKITAMAFEKNRPLTEEEYAGYLKEI